LRREHKLSVTDNSHEARGDAHHMAVFLPTSQMNLGLLLPQQIGSELRL
jgi:hypothetical protein